MKIGGKSTSGLKSYLRTTREFLLAARENSIYTNYLFMSLRLPIKFFQKMIFLLNQK